MTIEHFIIAKLAEAMNECGQGIDEQIAYGCMRRNQMMVAGSWERIAIRSGEVKEPYSPTFAKTLWAADDVFYGRQADITDGATAFARDPRVNSVQIGNWFFYRA